MANIQIVTDSTAYITKDIALKENIKIIPLSVTILGETKDEGYPGDFEEFYHKLSTSKEFPTTSQPSIDAYATVFQEAIDKGDEVICLTISSKVSGTHNSASAAAEMIAPDLISVIDSETASANLKLFTLMSKEMADKGMKRAEIVDIINKEKKKTVVDFTVDTLEYLKRGGRLTGTAALVGSLLNVKPVIGLVDGKLEAVAKARGKNKAIQLMIDKIPENSTDIAVVQISNLEEALSIKDKIDKRFPNAKVTIEELGPVIGTHLGPKAIGILTRW